MVQIMHSSQNFNLNHFKMVEGMGLKMIASRVLSVASPAHYIS
jgi:hypothetical protein